MTKLLGYADPPPPRLADLPLGTRLVAGLGHSTVVADMDFETYSEAGYVWTGERWGALPHASQGRKGLTVVEAARYAEHPSTEVLCLRYDLKDGRGQRLWLPSDPPPVDLFLYLRNGGLIEAWNVAFERLIWEHVCVKRYGWPPLPPAQLRCAMAKARAHALPGALANAGEVLGADVQKDKEGKRLIQLYCVPRNPTKTDARLRLPPDPKLYDYCGQDIAAEAEISSRVPDLEGDELRWWQTDQEINARGVAIDVAAVQACGEIVEQALARYNGELHGITSGAVSAASEIQKLTAWLHVQGVHLDSLDEEHVQQALTGTLPPPYPLDVLLMQPANTWTLPPHCRRALEIRATIGSAAVKKLYAMQNQVCADGRLRGLFTYHGARTSRTTGNGPQPTNLPNSGPRVAQCFVCNRHFGRSKPSCPWCGAQEVMATEREWSAAAVEDALVVMSGRSLDLVEMYFDEALPAISGCLRGMFVAAEGHDLICSDYSAIEAVVLAELAGETWRQEVFRTHGKIYEMSAAMVTGVTLEEQLDYRKRTGSHHPVRKKGKVMELACFTHDTQVLTDRGYVSIVDVSKADKLWDGVEWVTHQGVAPKGEQGVIKLDGVEMTPQHLVLCSDSWREASQLVSNARLLYQALEIGSGNLPSSGSIKMRAENCAMSGCVALVARPNTPSTCTTFGRVAQHAAGFARKENLSILKGLGVTQRTRTSCPRFSTGGVCCVDSPQLVAAVTTRATEHLRTTGAEAYKSTKIGGKIKGRFLSTLRRLLGGTIQRWRWIESTLMGATNPEISVLLLGGKTRKINAQCKPYSSAFSTLKPLSSSIKSVYDIVNAGPRNRFTIKTDSGHLIVHNCGYGGWTGSLIAFGADEFMTEDEMVAAAGAWRQASPAVVEFWGGQTRRGTWTAELFGIEGAAISAVQQPGATFECRGIQFVVSQDVLYCRLLSGDLLTYHRPRLRPSERRSGELTLSYEGWNSNPKNGGMGWVRMDTYGPKVVENIVQKTARDIQRHGILAQEAAGYRTVLHVYDENVSEVPEGWGSVEEFERLMSEMPPWAAGWPVRATGGWRGKRYRKD